LNFAAPISSIWNRLVRAFVCSLMSRRSVSVPSLQVLV
jgi:hypothetical protein